MKLIFFKYIKNLPRVCSTGLHVLHSESEQEYRETKLEYHAI